MRQGGRCAGGLKACAKGQVCWGAEGRCAGGLRAFAPGRGVRPRDGALWWSGWLDGCVGGCWMCACVVREWQVEKVAAGTWEQPA
eukprot:350454-Chlamydomonas_euryale.AAC.3